MRIGSSRSATRIVPLPGLLDSMGSNSLAAALPVDRRQSATARLIARGTSRLLHALGCCIISELALPSGRRADLVALDADGTVWIVEIKSSAADLRADTKWMEYRRHCDRLFFATSIDMRRDIFPDSAGLIVADAFDAEIICEAPEHPLPAAARRSVMLSFARAAALRLSAIHDPEGAHL